MGKFPFITASDHYNIVYIMCKKRRPQILRKTAHDRLNRWYLKWTHENFQIYAVPGVMNTFNAMISIVETVHQTTSLSTFYTLQAHAERILQKEQALDVGQACERSASSSQVEHCTIAKQRCHDNERRNRSVSRHQCVC